MAEVIFANLLKKRERKGVVVKGAGVGALIGEVMSDDAREALKRCGERVGDKPRPNTLFRPQMLQQFDYIICMETEHKQHIVSGGVYNTRAKVCTLDELTGCGEVPDPWCKPLDAYIKVCKQLQSACVLLYNVLLEGV